MSESKKTQLLIVPMLWVSIAISSIWAIALYSSLDFRIDRHDPPYNLHYLGALMIAGILLLTWGVCLLLSYFGTMSKIRPRISISVLVSTLVLFAIATILSSNHWCYDEVSTWINVYRKSIGSVVIMSIPLFLIAPMLKAPRGWFRVTLVSAILVSFFLVIKITHIRSVIYHLKDLLDPNEFMNGLVYLFSYIGKCLIRISIGFSIAFAVADTVLWTKKGFITEEIEKDSTEKPKVVSKEVKESAEKTKTVSSQLYKQAHILHYERGSSEQAKMIYEEILRNHPNSQEAISAQHQLDKLKLQEDHTS